MRAKEFFKGLSWLLVLNLLIKPAWIFIIDRQVQNIVGHKVYGVYFALSNLTYVLLFVADAGLSNMLTQRLAAGEKLHVRQLLRLKILLLIFYAVACASIAAATGVSQWKILGFLILIQSLTSVFVFLRGLLTANQFFKTDALFSVLDKSLLLLLCIGPVYGFFHPMTILLFLQLQTLSTLIAVSILFVLLARKKLFAAGDKTSSKKMATWTAPFVLIVLFMSAHNRLDAFLLERLHPNGALQAGIYAAAYRLLDAANMVGYLTASFLVPFLSRHQYEKELMQRVLLFSRHGLLVMGAGVAAFGLVFAPWLQQVLYHTADAYSNTVLRLCLLALPAYYLTQVYSSALTATAHFRLLIQTVLLSVVANVVLNIYLIPRYGAAGCCIAALVTQYGCGFLLWYISSRKLAIHLSIGSAFLSVTAGLAFGFFFYFGQKLTSNVWIILATIALLFFGVMISQRNGIRKLFLPFYK